MLIVSGSWEVDMTNKFEVYLEVINIGNLEKPSSEGFWIKKQTAKNNQYVFTSPPLLSTIIEDLH